jgi:hypothetical protein
MGCVPSKPAHSLSDDAYERTERTYGAWTQAEENDEHDFLEAQKTAVSVQNKLQAQFPDKFEAQEARKRTLAARGRVRACSKSLASVGRARPWGLPWPVHADVSHDGGAVWGHPHAAISLQCPP